MTSCFLTPEGEFRLMTKGAAELMVERCSYIIGKDGARLPLDQAGRQGLISKVVTPMTEAALRTIAVASPGLQMKMKQTRVRRELPNIT